MHFLIYYLKKVLQWHNKCLLDQSVVNYDTSTSGGIICRPLSTLKADILNITYDCYSQNNNVEVAEL